MTSAFYRFILRMHPPAFRQRFGDEMMSVFEDTAAHDSSTLVLDGVVSLARQWLLRTDSWKLPVALCGGFIQVFGFGMPMKGHQYWTENNQALTPAMQQVMLFAMALVCSLFLVIMFMSLWNTRFQRRRVVSHKSHRPAFPAAHTFHPSRGRK